MGQAGPPGVHLPFRYEPWSPSGCTGPPAMPPGLHLPRAPHFPHPDLGEAVDRAELVLRECRAPLVDHVGDDDDFAELADFYGVKEYGEDQWTAYLERGVPPRDVAPHRSNISSSSSSATIAPASPPMCNAPPV